MQAASSSYMTENLGDLGGAGEAGESVYGEKADMTPPGDGTRGDSNAMFQR